MRIVYQWSICLNCLLKALGSVSNTPRRKKEKDGTVIPKLGRLRQEDPEIQFSVSLRVSCHSNNSVNQACNDTPVIWPFGEQRHEDGVTW